MPVDSFKCRLATRRQWWVGVALAQVKWRRIQIYFPPMVAASMTVPTRSFLTSGMDLREMEDIGVVLMARLTIRLVATPPLETSDSSRVLAHFRESVRQ